MFSDIQRQIGEQCGLEKDWTGVGVEWGRVSGKLPASSVSRQDFGKKVGKLLILRQSHAAQAVITKDNADLLIPPASNSLVLSYREVPHVQLKVRS